MPTQSCAVTSRPTSQRCASATSPTADRRPQQWYRTIDRVTHALTAKPKLLIPDIKAEAHPVLDPGGLYPHHNLYWVASEQWNPEVLGGLLLSGVAQMFVECYAVKMRGGYLRFQAQYLRRIRVPRLDLIPRRTAKELERSFATRDIERATAAALDAYGLHELPYSHPQRVARYMA